MVNPGNPRRWAWMLVLVMAFGPVTGGRCETDPSAGEKEPFVFQRKSVDFGYSRSEIGGDAIGGFSNYSLAWASGPHEMMRFSIGLYYGQGSPGGEPDIQDGVQGISEAGIDLGFGAYLSPDRSPVGIYIPFGLRLSGMFWTYAYPAEVETEDGEIETWDGTESFVLTPYIGLGTSLLQTQKMNLGLSLTVGHRFTWGQVGHEFDKLLFEDVGEIRISFEAGIYY